MWTRVAIYGVLLGAGTLALSWLDYQHLARSRMGDLYILLIAAGFLTLGVFAGRRLFAGPPQPFDGNPQARAALGVSARELKVLEELAAGRSNKEIARRLGISPETVKTHVARLYDRLDARKRIDAINRARALGLVR